MTAEVVIVGAGIGGSALATVLARAGIGVLLLEKTKQHKDVVRGEWMAPWGVLEAQELGLLDLYEAAGANRPLVHQSFNDFTDGPVGELDLTEAMPALPVCLGHPRACDLLNEAAVSAGAELVRGITGLSVEPGTPPKVSYQLNGERFDLQPRLVVGADGRNGVVARQIGCRVTQDEEHHLFSGMLVEGADEWPDHLQVIATEGDVNVLAFPQGEGKVRIYLGWPKEERSLLVGPEGPQRFLERWQLDCVPQSDTIVKANPASPCIAYPNFDAWVDNPVREGVVLIGDAAGRNDPIIGQGLSITHRDVRMVRDALLGNQVWSDKIFTDYVDEREFRMSKLRITARLTTLRESVFGQQGLELRQNIHERLSADPDLGAPYTAAFIGPENLPDEVFSDAFLAQIVGEPIWSPALP